MGKYRTFNSSSSSDSSIMDHVECYDLNSNVWTANTGYWYRNDGKCNREEISQLGQKVDADFGVVNLSILGEGGWTPIMDFPGLQSGISYTITNVGDVSFSYLSFFNADGERLYEGGTIAPGGSVAVKFNQDAVKYKVYGSGDIKIQIIATDFWNQKVLQEVAPVINGINSELNSIENNIVNKILCNANGWLQTTDYKFENDTTYIVKCVSGAISYFTVYNDNTEQITITVISGSLNLSAGEQCVIMANGGVKFRFYGTGETTASIEESSKVHESITEIKSFVNDIAHSLGKANIFVIANGWTAITNLPITLYKGEKYTITNVGDNDFAHLTLYDSDNTHIYESGNVVPGGEIEIIPDANAVKYRVYGSGELSISISADNIIEATAKKIDGDYAVKSNIFNRLYVDCAGSQAYTTIGAAISAINEIGDAAHDNQYEIVVYPGTYNEVNLLIPAWVHIHGLRPNSVIITSKNWKDHQDSVLRNAPLIDQSYGSSKLSNLILESWTGYVLHYDSHIELRRATLYNENVTFKKMYVPNGGTHSIIGGGTFQYGCLYWFNGCTFYSKTYDCDVACHTNINANYELNTLRFTNCKFINTFANILNVGGWGNNVLDIKNCQFTAGWGALANGNGYSNARNEGGADTYTACTQEWQVIGGGNKNMPIRMVNNGEALMIECDAAVPGQIVTISGNAVDALFGSVHEQVGGNTIKASVTGSYMVRDTKAGTGTQVDKYQMWKRLGDCSTTNKVLNVSIDGGEEMTYIFNQNYESLQTPETTILAAINSVLSGCSIKKNNLPLSYWNSIELTEKTFIQCDEPNDIIAGIWVRENGKKCNATTPLKLVCGVAVSSAVYGQMLQVWMGDYYVGGTFGWDSDAYTEYGIDENGQLSADAPIKIGYAYRGVLYRY